MREKGLKLMSEGKMAIVLLLNEIENQGCIGDPGIAENEANETSALPLLQKLLCDHESSVSYCKPVFYLLISGKILLIKIHCCKNLFVSSDGSCIVI